jgi:hypothetical protein
MKKEELNGNIAKPILAEEFVGSISEIQEFFRRKWCRVRNIDESKWKYIAPSSIDGLKIRNKESGREMSFWAGSSGTNNMAIDSTGGCHDLSFHNCYTFEVVV